MSSALSKTARLAACVLLACLSVLPARGSGQRTRSLDVELQIQRDGSCLVREYYDVESSEGTERYIVKGHLQGMGIRDFQVSEDGVQFENIGRWNIDASLREKAHRCGVVTRSDGVELCWGIGSYGPHKFDVSYRITGAVKALRDYDMLFLTCVNEGMSPAPERVSVRVGGEGFDVDTLNCRAWGFGFDGKASFGGGEFRMKSSGRFTSSNRAIVLLRLEKGIVRPSDSIDVPFDDFLDQAMEGASFPQDRDVLGSFFSFLFAFFFAATLLIMVRSSAGPGRLRKKKLLGCRPGDVPWQRDVPIGGDLAQAAVLARMLGEDGGSASSRDGLSSALILKMLQDGVLGVSKDSKGRVEFTFNDDVYAAIGNSMLADARSLYSYMKEAAGSDGVLQHKEFKRWGTSNAERLSAWPRNTLNDGREALRREGSLESGFLRSGLTPSGQAKARELYGLKKFLLDSTLISERSSQEVVLWQNYLIYAALLGIADKVHKELNTINPELYGSLYSGGTQVAAGGGLSPYDVWVLTRNLGSTVRTAPAVASAVSSRSARGFGGGMSVGGGFGSFGGGIGGGAR